MQTDEASSSSPRRRIARCSVDGSVLVAFTALAAYTRYRPLAPRSLFLDDAWVSVGYRAHGITQLARTTFTSPLFSLATDLWLKVVGLSSLHAQLLAFVAGIVGPAAMYLLARTMRLGRAAALLAGALVLFAPFHILYSSRVKQYTLDALLTMVVLFVAWRALESPSARRVSTLTVTALAATLASIAVAPVVAGAYVALGAQTRRRRGPRTIAAGATGVYTVVVGVWYLAVIRPASHASLREYWQQAGGFWADDHLRLETGFHLALTHVARGFSALPPTLTIALLALTAIVAFVRSLEHALLLVTPGATALALSAARVAPVGARVDVYLYPTFAALVAFAAEPLLQRSAWLTIAPVAVVGLLLVATPLPSYYPQENIAPLVARLEARAAPQDPIVLYRMGVWGFALYTRWPVDITRDSTDPVPFDVRVDRPHVYEVSRHRSAVVIDTLAGGHPAGRVWFIGSHASPRTVLAIDDTIEDDGFRMVSKLGDHGAWLDEFTRTRTTHTRRGLRRRVDA